MTDGRPNPDELLVQVNQQEARRNRGKLKVFFGAAAGVGKTFAMLEEARNRAAEGLDVVVGYAEAHARPETEAILLGMEILPYKVVSYKGATLKEFDLDAALARKPALVLVDELAHTNAPGLRHQKRYQDVAELLDAGINVYSTLNVQHLESVNDVVERITGVKVRETLPDAMLDQADEVELVDTSPDELLERFREGKIYRPEQAERAAKHFFAKGNLIALRELALRRTADRVDAQMLDFRRENAVKSTWAASERILVCVGPSPLSARLVRATRRMATGLKAPWVAVYVETPASASFSPRDLARVDRHLRLAEQLEGRTVTLSGHSVAEEIIAYARAQNITRIVIGKPAQPRWRDLLFGSFVDQIIRNSGQIDVHLIRGDADEAEPPPEQAPAQRPRDIRGCIWAAGITALVTAIGWPLYHRLHMANANILMGYLLGVLWIATHHSRSAAVLASILGVAAFDVCFVPPYLTLAVSDQQYLITFGIMLATALVISALTHRVRDQAEAARCREQRTSALLALSRELASLRLADEIIVAAGRHVADVLAAGTVFLLNGTEGKLVPHGECASALSAERELSVARWVFDHEQSAGRGTSTLPAAEGTYLPLKASRGAVGVMGLFFAPGAAAWDSEQQQLAEAFASQVATAVERAALAEEAHQAWERVETEFLRNTLLSGVSHDLRTPLAAITGAASTLIETGPNLPDAGRAEMLDTIYSEAERMERLINNLLDMTRMEAGGLLLRREWHPLADIVGSALRHLDRRLRGRAVKTCLPADLPLLHVDEVTFEQVLVNLVDNAANYTPAGSAIEISAMATDGRIIIEIADNGPGLPGGCEERVFEKFFRASSAHGSNGIGLGLAICKGIVEAHGGRIAAANRPEGGAVFRIALPLEKPPPMTVEAH